MLKISGKNLAIRAFAIALVVVLLMANPGASTDTAKVGRAAPIVAFSLSYANGLRIADADVAPGDSFKLDVACKNPTDPKDPKTSRDYSDVVVRTDDAWIDEKEIRIGFLNAGETQHAFFTGSVPKNAPLVPHVIKFQCIARDVGAFSSSSFTIRVVEQTAASGGTECAPLDVVCKIACPPSGYTITHTTTPQPPPCPWNLGRTEPEEPCEWAGDEISIESIIFPSRYFSNL